MDQVSLSEAEYTVKKRKTRREKFLEQMDGLIPWKRLEKKITRHDAKPGHGRRPNVHDMTQTETLRHGKEKTCWGDAGDQGVDKRDALADSDIDWEIAVRPGKRKTLNQREQRLGHTKAQVRAKVEHPLRIIKRPFGYSTVRYRRLAKNNNRLQVLSAFANRLRCKHMLSS